MITLLATRLAGSGTAARMLLAPLLGFLCLAAFGTSHAEAKTCIWNKAGFVLQVAWIKDGQVVRTDERPLAQGVCSNDGDNYPYTIVLSAKDAQLADNFTKGIIKAVATVLGVLPGAGPGLDLVAELAKKGIPTPQGTFYQGAPEQDRYLDVWGTVWDPKTGPGGPA